MRLDARTVITIMGQAATAAVLARLARARNDREERLVELGYELGRQDGYADRDDGEDRPAVLLDFPARGRA